MPTLDVAINSLRAKHGADQFDAATAKIQKSAVKADKGVAKVDKGMNSLGTTMGKLGKIMIGFVGFYAIGRFVKSGVKELAKYERQLAEVSTMLDDQTMRYLPQYKDELADLAIAYGESTETLSRGLYDILSASIDAADALEVLEVATKAAKAGISDTGTAADAITTILNSYSMEASEAGRVSDILFAIIKRGKTTFSQLGPSIGKVTSLAASAGLSIEEVAAALATMTRAGVQTDIAITSLKSILTTFLSPQQRSVDVAKKWGIELNTNTLRTKGLTGVVRQLKNMNQESVAQIFSNVRALTGLSALLQQSEGHTYDLAVATDSLGMSEAALAKMTDTTAYKLDQLREAWKFFQRESLEGAVPLVEDWAEILTETAPKMRTLTRAISEFSTKDYPEAVLRFKAAVHELRAELWNGVVSEKALQRERDLAKTFSDTADKMYAESEALKTLDDNAEKWSKRIEEWNKDFPRTINYFDDFGVKTLVAADAIGQIVPPSEELATALVEVEAKLVKVQETIDTLGMTNLEKQIRQLDKLGEGLSAEELAKFNAEMEKLRGKSGELEQLKTQEQIQKAKQRQLDSDFKDIQLLAAQTRELKFQKELIGLTNEEKEKATADAERMKAIWSVDESQRDYMKQTADGYRDAAYALAEATAEHEKWMEQQAQEAQLAEERKYAEERAQKLVREIQLEKEILLLTNEERERAIKLQQLEAETKILGTEKSKELVEQYKQELIELQKMQEVAKIAEDVRSGIEGVVRAPLEALLDHTKDLGDMVEDQLKEMGRNILRTWYEQMVTQKIQQAAMNTLFGGAGGGGGLMGSLMGGAQGAERGRVFENNRITRMDKGGVLNETTAIPLQNGTAIAAEKGSQKLLCH